MKPSDDQRAIHSSGSTASASFGISHKDTPHIMGLLREGIYSDKILAVLREYSSNAWDSHREAGIADRPIEIHVPTYDEPLFTVRDHGKGLSRDEVFEIYTQYGASTRRGTNDAVGMLGIGSKSGFAYSDSFTVISHHGGVKRIYIAVLDPSDKGEIQLVHEEPSAETGIEIQIATRPADVHEFNTKASQLFQHYSPRPAINIILPPIPEASTILTHGSLCTADQGGSTRWIAVMGCVPYRVNIDQLPRDQLGKFMPRISGSLFFGIGEVQVSASREELKYTDRTKAALVEKINDLVDEFVQHTLGSLGGAGISPWEMRLRAQVLNTLELPFPEDWNEITDPHVKLIYDAADFSLVHNRSASTRISVSKDVRLLIDDTGEDLVGYRLAFNDYVIRPAPGKTFGEAKIALDAAIEASGMVGVRVEFLSICPYTAPYKKPKKVNNPKHKVSTFKLIPRTHYKNPYSAHWDTESRVPDKGDVYVVTHNFKADQYRDFYPDYIADDALCRAFDFTMPKVYGYKTTDKKPINPALVVGTEYRVWRKDLAKQILDSTPDLPDLIVELQWARLERENIHGHYSHRPGAPSSQRLAAMVNDLGDQHSINRLYTRHAHAAKVVQGLGANKAAVLTDLTKRLNIRPGDSEAARELKAILDRYPLFAHVGISSLWNPTGTGNPGIWMDYVQLVDSNHKLTQADAARAAKKAKNHAPRLHDHS